jgi:hypothetical protein
MIPPGIRVLSDISWKAIAGPSRTSVRNLGDMHALGQEHSRRGHSSESHLLPRVSCHVVSAVNIKVHTRDFTMPSRLEA